MPSAVFSAFPVAAHLWVRGEDAATFLQGQFTNDLVQPPRERAATYGLWLNQKGRALADSYILSRAGGDGFELISFSSPAGAIQARLEPYVIADDVAIEDRTENTAAFVVAGSGAEALLRSIGGGERAALPAAGTFVEMPARDAGPAAAGAVARVFRARVAAPPAWALVFPVAAQTVWREHLQSAVARGLARETTPQELAASRIEAGIPEVPRELGPGDLPGEGGLEDEAISYTKGCYLGQEVMARLRNLGQVRRRLFVVRSRENPTPPPAISAPLFLGARAVGELRNLVPATDGAIGFAMLQLNVVQPGALLAVANADAPPTIEVVRIAEGHAW